MITQFLGGPFGTITTPPIDQYGNPLALTVPATTHHGPGGHPGRAVHRVGDHDPGRPRRRQRRSPLRPHALLIPVLARSSGRSTPPSTATAATMAALTRLWARHVGGPVRAAAPGPPWTARAPGALEGTVEAVPLGGRRRSPPPPTRTRRPRRRRPPTGGVPNRRSKVAGSSAVAGARKEKIPPPPLSATTTVSGAVAAGRPGPTRRGGRRGPPPAPRWDPSASATPSGVDTTPSIPLAPRLASTRGGSARGAPKASTSRTGMDDDTTSGAPAGRPRDQTVGQDGLVRPVRPGRHVRTITRRARASARSHASGQAAAVSRRPPTRTGHRPR